MPKQRRLVSVLNLALTTGALVIGLASPAIAGTFYFSGWAYYGPVYGHSYGNRSDVGSNSDVQSDYSIAQTDGKSIPGGYSGGQATLYKNGAACASSSLYYYPSTVASSWGGLGGHGYCGYGNYNARGSTAAYNGNGYNYYYTSTSPIYQH